jgi:hypothetical protein
MTPSIAISYTTCNRPKILESNIKYLLPILIRYNIPLYICDDSNNSHTEDIILELTSIYKNIFYKRNLIKLGHDLNFFQALNYPNEDYVWYLGDSIYFNVDKFELIYNNLILDYDFIFINSIHDDTNIYEIENIKTFFIDKIWYLTLSGSTIYGKNTRVKSIEDNDTDKWLTFAQLGQVLNYSFSNNVKILWIGEPLIHANSNKKDSFWHNKIIETFIYKWSKFIFHFDYYFNNEEIVQIIKSHAIQKKLFTFKTILKMRSTNGLKTIDIFKYYSELKIASNFNVFGLFIFSIIPSFFYKIVYFLYKKVK